MWVWLKVAVTLIKWQLVTGEISPDLAARIQDGDLITNFGFFDYPTACVQAIIRVGLSSYGNKVSIAVVISFSRHENFKMIPFCIMPRGFDVTENKNTTELLLITSKPRDYMK